MYDVLIRVRVDLGIIHCNNNNNDDDDNNVTLLPSLLLIYLDYFLARIHSMFP